MADWKPRPRRWETRQWHWPILKGVPIPKAMREPAGYNVVYRALKPTIAAMEVGDCIVLAGWAAQPGVYKAAQQPGREVKGYAKDFGYKIKCRTVGRGVVMVWRVA